jgi:hypothetical protein
MKRPGPWNRRGFDVIPNGFFTVLRSSGWFPAFRLPGGFRYLIGEPGTNRPRTDGAPTRQVIGQSVGIQTEIILRQIDAEPLGARVVLRGVLLAMVASALTLALLLWIMHP